MGERAETQFPEPGDEPGVRSQGTGRNPVTRPGSEAVHQARDGPDTGARANDLSLVSAWGWTGADPATRACKELSQFVSFANLSTSLSLLP